MRSERTFTRTVRTARRVAPPLVLAPAQRQVIYRTLAQERVVPRVAPSVPGYPPFPPPATTGYAGPTPVDTVDEDVYEAPVAPAPVYRPVYAVGSVMPARVALTPLPEAVAVAVPAAQPYSYATVDGRVLLVDPVTDTVVADITP